MLFSVRSKNESKIIFMWFPVDYFKENCIFQIIIASKEGFFQIKFYAILVHFKIRILITIDVTKAIELAHLLFFMS